MPLGVAWRDGFSLPASQAYSQAPLALGPPTPRFLAYNDHDPVLAISKSVRAALVSSLEEDAGSVPPVRLPGGQFPPALVEEGCSHAMQGAYRLHPRPGSPAP